ncbi:hypothetical protein VPH35_051926 [Triticum aestivum]|uniref:Disease resistance protein At4g27190-like leucine-rich repeats domain-containing protein n=3 Tax=Triticum aestivum TaxID=4565 RepID=A0A3B6TZF6_WHEAT|nr:uncharacterized protein LOC123064251 [Triticum aestivum]
MSSHLLTQHIYSTDVDGAREEIFRFLKYKSYVKVIYFDGWDRFGASAVLRSIAAVLPSRRTTPELCFDRIIYIDCSEWKNRRAMQRAIAEALELDPSVMASLDEQDEEDDFNEVDESSRNEIGIVGQAIDQTLRDTKLMMIFLNGSDEEVDVGIPLTRYGNNVMIWTFSRRCLELNHGRSRVENKLRYTHAILGFRDSIKELSLSQFCGLLHQEAATIVARNPCMLDINPTIVADCCLYELFLHYNFHMATNFDWVSHASNYWVCDAIIQGYTARDISNALHREINWKCNDVSLLDGVLKWYMEQLMLPFLVINDDVVYKEGPYCWISVTSRNIEVRRMQTIPAVTSSFFLAFERSDHPPTLPNVLFEHSSKLGVLVLKWCAFDFALPPFLKCRSLKFLGLENCTDDKTRQGDDHTDWAYLYSLSVLDLRYTEWNQILSEEKMDLMTNIRELNIEGVRGWQYIANLQRRLPNLQRLRIIKPTCQWKTSEDFDNSFIDKPSMEILDLSGNSDMEILPASLSTTSSLRLLVLDGCYGLENVGGLPLSLEYFSFNGHGPASQWTQTVELPPKQFRSSTTTGNKDIRVSKISLQGCTQLKNLFLCWLPNLIELDLSETAIKILDFKSMVVQVPRLKRLFLIGCKHLRAIIWLDESGSKVKSNLELVCIDTRVGIVCARPSINRIKSFRLQVHVVAMDARLTRSLKGLLWPYLKRDTPEDVLRPKGWDGPSRKGPPKDVYSYNIHLTSSPVYDGVVQFEATPKNKIGPSDQKSLQQIIPAGPYNDVLSMVSDPPMQAFPQPPTTQSDRHIEIAKGSCYVERELNGDLGGLMGYYTESLHVHDVSIRAIVLHDTSVPYGCPFLRWCCVERCPKLDTVFVLSDGFIMVETLWASDLLMARWIWSENPNHIYLYIESFQDLQHLHLRSCPSLQFVLPVFVSSFNGLKTLHIIHCGNLVHVFELDKKYANAPHIIHDGVLFPKLTTIHLHDLPKLQQICEVKMVAPALESIKIRGCWSLRRLPSVGARGQGEKKPTIEIENDVWDVLEWDDDHCPDHFEPPVHSRHYKERLPRVSVLR